MLFGKLSDFLSLFNRKKKQTLKFKKSSKHCLEKIVGYTILNEEYYLKALTHRSYLEVFPDIEKSNERLEFLGDSVLGLVVSNYLFLHFPKEEEGFLTKTRSHLVNSKALTQAAKYMNLDELIFVDKRFKKASGDGFKRITADSLEALIGAIFLDKGFRYAKRFVEKWIILPNLKSGNYKIDKNYKGKLLELTHMKKVSPPEYIVVVENGPEHKKMFGIEVQIDKEVFGYGEGNSKKAAEQSAAKEALKKFSSEESV